jgi:flagellar export protein FliJ
VTTFRFPLKRVLDWRHTQLELEEAQYKQQAAALAELDRVRAEIEAQGIRAEVQVREWNPVAGCDLGALSSFRTRVKSEEAQLALRRTECERKLAEQQATMLEARRRCRLLERLEERRLAEWRAARDREIDELAAESFLAKWK